MKNGIKEAVLHTGKCYFSVYFVLIVQRFIPNFHLGIISAVFINKTAPIVII
jgi:hypothetical protein